MKRRVWGILLSAVLTLSAMGFAIPMTAMADSMMVVTVGADLSPEEKNMILNYFNVAGQSYTTITVTNEDEWAHLGSYMSRDIVGYRTISCALIRPMTSGGIQVKTANLTYVTSNMIASNLATAGVKNCEVLAAAPFQVSGTGALTGTLMAYENLSGVTLDTAKKEAAAQEFATTYELGQTIGQQEAQQIVNDVKMQVINGNLEEDNSITYEEITEIVNDVVNNYTNNNITNNTTTNTTTNNTTINNGLSEEDIAALQNLAVSIAQQSYDQGTLDALTQIQKTLEGQTQTTSTAATTQIEQNAAPTAQPSEAPATAPDQGTVSAADQALSEDSLLTNTNESALAGTTADGTVISSSTAESTIDTTVATNLDAQIESQQNVEEPQPQPEAQPQPQPEPVATQSGIPEPTDVTVLGTDEPVVENPVETPAEPVVENPVETPVETPAEPVVENPVETPIETPAEPVVENPVETPVETPAEPVVENPEGTDPEPENPEGTDPEGAPVEEENVASITADDIANGSVSFTTGSAAENGSQPASGTLSVAVVVPYEDLTPVSGALLVTAGSGAEAATLNIDPEQSNLVLLTSDDDDSVPAGSTKIVMVPKDDNDISLQTDFVPVAGETYTYTLNAQFETIDGTVDIQIYNYDPYYGASVSDKGFRVNGSCVNKSSAEDATGSVIFPADGSTYATVTSDEADVTIISQADGSELEGVSAGSDAAVTITPYMSGPVTLDITYYAAAPEEGVEAAQTGSAQYTVYFD